MIQYRKAFTTVFLEGNMNKGIKEPEPPRKWEWPKEKFVFLFVRTGDKWIQFIVAVTVMYPWVFLGLYPSLHSHIIYPGNPTRLSSGGGPCPGHLVCCVSPMQLALPIWLSPRQATPRCWARLSNSGSTLCGCVCEGWCGTTSFPKTVAISNSPHLAYLYSTQSKNDLGKFPKGITLCYTRIKCSESNWLVILKTTILPGATNFEEGQNSLE